MRIKNNYYTLQYILTIFIIAMQLLYPLKHLLSSYIQIPIFILWVLLLNKNMKCYNDIIISKTFIIIIFSIFILIKILISNNYKLGFFDPMKVLISYINLIISYSLYLYIRSINKNRKKLIIKNSIMFILITNLFSLYYVFFVDPQAIRNTQRKFLIGAGDFEFVYSLVILLGVCFSFFYKKNRSNYKIYIFYLISFITLFKSNFVTALVLFVISLIVNYLINSNKKITINYILIFIIFLFYLFKEKIALFIENISRLDIFYWSTQEKILAIANLLRKGDELNTLEDRALLALRSIETFLKNPVFGIDYKNYGQFTIGGHSQWPDDLARHGIFGVFIIFMIFVFIIKDMYNKANNSFDKKNIIISWIIFFILGFFNPNMLGSVYMVIFTIIPFLSIFKGDIHEK